MLFSTDRKSQVKLNSLPKNAYQHLTKAHQRLYQHLTQQGYFSANPKTVRTIYLVLGIILTISGLAIGPALMAFGLGASGFIPQGTSLLIGPMVSGLIVLAFSFFMPARSAKGRRALSEVAGLREWIRLGAWREKIHEKLNLFEEVLPFAIAFGLTQKFIQAFKAADIKDLFRRNKLVLFRRNKLVLSWYHSSHPFNAVYLSNSINNFGSSLNSGIAATQPKSASSGGSGFSGGSSGGGFGGGGGGSW